jgi:hypothetical protein
MAKNEFKGDIETDGKVLGTNIGQKVYTVPVGTALTGTEPDGSLWVEYQP